MIGKSITINGQPYEVAGFCRRVFLCRARCCQHSNGTEQADIFLPLPLAPAAAQVRTGEDYNIVGKLKAGVSVAQAQAEMDTITARLRPRFSGKLSTQWRADVQLVRCWSKSSQSASRPTGASRSSIGAADCLRERRQSSAFAGWRASRKLRCALLSGPAAGASCAHCSQESVTARSVRRALGVLICVLSVKWMHLLEQRASRGCLTSAWMDACCCLRCRSRCFSGILFGLAPALRIPAGFEFHVEDASRGAAGQAAVWGRGNNVRRLL